MKKILKSFFLLLIGITISAQVGIKTNSPTETLDVNGHTRVRNIEETSKIPAFILTENEDGVIQKVLSAKLQMNNEVVNATRFVGGNVSITLFASSNGALTPSYVINGFPGSKYNMGNKSETSKIGAINNITGRDLYEISNPSNGVYDIKFKVPFNQIYGISANIYDNYQSNSTTPNPSIPGNRLRIRDNVQVSYIDNTGFRVKTGGNESNSGAPTARSFTFLVTGI